MGKDSFQITTKSASNHHVVSLRGVLDVASESALSEALEPLCRSDAPRVLIDCKELRYVNSAVFGLFFYFHRQCESRGGQLVLCRLPPKIESILKLLGLTHVLHLHASVEEALHDMPTVNSPG